jgi:hypothetical protein
MSSIIDGLQKIFGRYLSDAFFVQLGRGAGGAAITLAPLALGPVGGSHWSAVNLLLLGIGLVVAWTVPKEYVFDILVEKQTYADGWIDQRSYLIGSGIAVGATLIAWACR